MQFENVALWGMGLLGGSLGLALRESKMAGRVIGIGRNEERLAKSIELGACDVVTTNPEEGFAQADLIILCTPVVVLADSLPDFAKYFKRGAIVTDVGSTKRRIVEVADQCLAGRCRFVGSHPMSGAEVSGVEHARADLYKNNPCFLTPSDATDIEALSILAAFWRRIGSRVIITTPQRHDQLVASISHVPHLASVALSLLAADMGEDENYIAAIAGNGFWGTTRLAKGDLSMWSEICAENRELILNELDRLIEILATLRRQIDTRQCDATLNRAREFRLELDQLRPRELEGGAP